MDTSRVHQILIDQKESFDHKSGLIERDIALSPFIETQQVVIISGIRRCGKSSLLYLIKEKMQLNESEYCYFNFDDERVWAETSLPDLIYQQHLSIYAKEPVFFFDEIQNIPKWEKFVNRMYEKGYKFFITGSNAQLLSSEISTSLTGRNKVLHLFPFSFLEYLRLKASSISLTRMTSAQKALVKHHAQGYLQMGGFPLILKEDNLDILSDYFRDILYRDIIARYGLSRTEEIRQLAIFLASHVGKRFSYRTLLTVSGLKSTHSVKDYLDYFRQSYLFYTVKKFDYSIKKQNANPQKVYAVDSAFANKLGFRFTEDRGRLLENVIYIELLRRKKEVFYHSDGGAECDFIVREGIKVTAALQVCWTLHHENLNRELGGLQSALSTYDLDRGLLIVWEAPHQRLAALPEGIDLILASDWLVQR